MEYKTRKWHDKCFQCVVCKSLVGSKPFIIPNETDVYCVSCFEEKFATKCTKCKKIMTTGGVTFKNEVGIFRIYLTSWQLYPYFASIPFRHGIANVLCVPIADAFQRARNSHRGKTNPIAPIASANFSPRDVRLAANLLQEPEELDLFLLKAAIGTPNVLFVQLVQRPWPAKASSLTERTSFALNAPRKS